MEQEPQCTFCNKANMRGRVVQEGEDGRRWYAFIPQDPEIFGHILVTVDAPHIQNIEDVNPKELGIMYDLAEGITRVAVGLKRIQNVRRVYVSMLGESPNVHMHYHLVPRYEFKSMKERIYWSTRYGIIEGNEQWRRFYSRPTLRFANAEGFRYLGEVERTYNEYMLEVFSAPDDELLGGMARAIKTLISNP